MNLGLTGGDHRKALEALILLAKLKESLLGVEDAEAAFELMEQLEEELRDLYDSTEGL